MSLPYSPANRFLWDLGAESHHAANTGVGCFHRESWETGA